MSRIAPTLLSVLLGVGVAAAAPAPGGFNVAPLPPPAPRGAVLASIACGLDGAVWAAWTERRGGSSELGCARLPRRGGWDRPHVVAIEKAGAPAASAGPALAVDRHGIVYALWVDPHDHACLSHSADAGATWTTPVRWAPAAASQQNFSLARLADGRVLATWFQRERDGAGAQLHARMVGAPQVTGHVIDAVACDGAAPAIAPFLDGGARVAYRGRATDGGRDIVTVRLANGHWEPPQVLNPGGWRPDNCPAAGPRLATDGSRMAAAWFTAADSTPRIEASFSPDAGERWLLPLRVDHGHPAGPVDVVLLRDRTLLVTWLEADGSLWLRRISPDFALAGEVELAPRRAAATALPPRIALRRDYAGDRADAEVLVIYEQAAPARLGAVRVTVAEGALLTAERNCDCLPTPAQLRGFAIRGHIVTIDAAAHRVRVRHDEVPGVFAAGEDTFEVAVPALGVARAGAPFLGRIAPGDGGWQLFDLRYLGAPAGE